MWHIVIATTLQQSFSQAAKILSHICNSRNTSQCYRVNWLLALNHHLPIAVEAEWQPALRQLGIGCFVAEFTCGLMSNFLPCLDKELLHLKNIRKRVPCMQ